MKHADMSAGNVLLASTIAGPLFVCATLAAEFYLKLPAAIPVSAKDLLEGLLVAVYLLVPIMLVGFIIAVMPNLLGMTLMVLVSRQVSVARTPLAWGLAGATLGLGAAHLFEAPPSIAFGLATTSAVCAIFCRRKVVFRSPE